MDYLTLFEKGGDLMWIILLFLIVGTAVFLERGLYFFLTYTPFEQFEAGLSRILAAARSTGERPDLSELRPGERLPLSELRLRGSADHRMAAVFLGGLGQASEARTAAVERTGAGLIDGMERRIGILQVIGAVAPLIGLLGTILGMMDSFERIAATGGQADISDLAGGIWTAMITTAFGLAAAIPAHLAHGYLHSILNARIRKMNAVLQHLEEWRHDLPGVTVDGERVTAGVVAEVR